jgi:hypothetical protein
MLIVTLQMIVGWAYNAMYFSPRNARLCCHLSHHSARSIITKGISLFDLSHSEAKKTTMRNNSWWTRHVVQPVRNFVFQADRDTRIFHRDTRASEQSAVDGTALLERPPR